MAREPVEYWNDTDHMNAWKQEVVIVEESEVVFDKALSLRLSVQKRSANHA